MAKSNKYRKSNTKPTVKDNWDGQKDWNDEHTLEKPPSKDKQEEAKKNENYQAVQVKRVVIKNQTKNSTKKVEKP